MRKHLAIIIAVGLVVAPLTGCMKSNKNAGMNHPNMLRVDVGAEVPSLDPLLAEDTTSTRIAFDLFAGLVDFDQHNDVIPGLASHWVISPSGTTYTFYLRKNLKFSDGTPITADDFVFTWQRLVDPETASPYNFLLANVVNGEAIIKGQAKPNTLGVSAPDPTTFVVKLANPNPVFIASLTLPNVYVISKANVLKYGNNWTDTKNIVTSGAYALTDHVINGYILADKNPYFYDAKNVKIEKVKYFPYVETNAAISSYKAGGLDLTWQNVPIDQYKNLQLDYPKQLHTIRQEAIYYFDFNNKLPIFANVKLRQALSMAIDRKALVERVVAQGQVPLYSTVTPTVEDNKFAKVTYDWAAWPRQKQIDVARKLYQEAGYSKDHPLHISISYNTNDMHKKVTLAIASMWKSILGAQVDVQNQEWKTFIQARHKGDYTIARDGWVADYNSVTTYTQLYQCGSAVNNSHYCNLEYDKLIAKARLQANPHKRIKTFQMALQIPLNDYATIPLFQYTYTRLVKPYVLNYDIKVNYLDHVQTKWMKLKK